MFYRISLLIPLIVIFFFTACDVQEDSKSGAYRKQTPDIVLARGETVKITQSGLNPIDHALSLVGLKRSRLSRPLYHEEGYRMLCRIPLIDMVAKSPFYLHYWADVTSVEIQKAAEKGLYQTLEMMTKNINGSVNYKLGDSTGFFRGNLAEAYQSLCKRHGANPDHSLLKVIEKTGFSPVFSNQAGMLVFSLSEASFLAKQAFLKLNKNELAYLSERPERFFFPNDNRFNFLTASTHVQEKVVAITRKIDFMKLFRSGLLISKAVDRFIDYIRNLENPESPAHYFRDKVKTNGLLMDIPTPIGHILISGQNNDTHTRSGALLIDLGGNDLYTGSIAVGHLVPGRVAISIDIGGDDTYDAGKQPYSQGCGCLGVGILADLSGSDQYLAGDMAQACGMYGLGLLTDLGGKDSYAMGMIGQGLGVFGLGLLQDTSGDDTYMISGLGQGTGSTMGHGCLCDTEGNDKYLANRNTRRGLLIPDEWCHVQGAGLSIRSPDWRNYFSFYGGVGLLTDNAGNDVYFASDGNCMGSSYFMSIGALVDHDGDDIYMPKNGHGLCYAVHLSSAVLIDRKGNDNYFGSNQTGGVGSDRSVAIFVDYEGNDTYGPTEEYIRKMIIMESAKKGREISEVELKNRTQQKMADASFAASLKPKALGLLIDYRGNDRYFARQAGWVESCGGILPPEEPHNWNHALLLDLGGKDFYYKDGRKDNHYFRYFKHGLCYDTEFAETDLVGTVTFPPRVRNNDADENLLNNRGKGPEQGAIKRLFDPDLFVRYAAIGEIAQQGPDTVYDLVALLIDSPNKDSNLDILEIINHFVVGHRLHHNHYRSLESLLKAKDPFVRGFAARIFGLHKVEGSLPAVKNAIQDPNGSVRPYVVRALGRLGGYETIPLLADISANDVFSECRRYAVLALGELAQKFRKSDLDTEKRIMKTLLHTLKDEDETVRTAAASVLSSFNFPEVQTALEKSLKDGSVYVRRAASKSLILKGFKSAIAVLIESLNYPSRDTFENYDHELANDLAFYCGVDFAKEKRYAYNTWKNWWDTHRDSIDLTKNLELMKKIQTVFKVQREDEGIAIFDQLIAENPDNAVVKKRYKRFCYEWITFRLLTRKHITQKTLERCLRLQRIISELEPDNSRSKARVASFLARLSRFEEAVSIIKEALEIEPDNNQYRQALNHYTSLLRSRLKLSE